MEPVNAVGGQAVCTKPENDLRGYQAGNQFIEKKNLVAMESRLGKELDQIQLIKGKFFCIYI